VSDDPILPCSFVGEVERPLIAAAIHAGHAVRAEIAERLAIEPAARLREEDPYTDRWTGVAPLRIIGQVSRFEVDLNRPREAAVYRTPAEAWGLQVWKRPLPEQVLQRSLQRYDAFYAELRRLLDEAERRFGRFVVFDLHSYNHQRAGPDGPPADSERNPDVNIGTGSMDRRRWASVVDRFRSDIAGFDYPGGRLDVRENVNFRGGHFAAWIHRHYAESGCALAIEFKKFFMDEWTGQAYDEHLEAIGRALGVAAAGVLQEL
jgi:N-formylglutamate deformylase